MNKDKAQEILQVLRDNEVMSDHDLDNLAFLITASKETIRDWFETVPEEDIEYAKTILTIASQYFSDDKADIDVTQANQVLAKFML